ncbi:hypothetical protein [Chromobacterium amazonense]|uniref:hypothetical protein n=1 Tax=Chromobacterium amazonense TaxID=1382803 RepID=UPI0031F683A8
MPSFYRMAASHDLCNRAIELYKDNKLKVWLEKSYWGSRTYKNPEEEQMQFELALKG